MGIKNRSLTNEAKRKTVQVNFGTIATSAGDNDIYVIAPVTGHLDSVDFSSTDAMAQHSTNHITFSITNLGLDGTGSTVMLDATKNTTDSDVAGNFNMAAATVYHLHLSNVLTEGQYANREVVAGDRLRIRITAAGTLANTLTYPVMCLRFIDESVS